MSGIVQTLTQPVSLGLMVVSLLVALTLFFLIIARIESRNRQTQARLMAELYVSGRNGGYRGGDYMPVRSSDTAWLVWLLPLGLAGIVGFAAIVIHRQDSPAEAPALAQVQAPNLSTTPSAMLDNAPPAVKEAGAISPVPTLTPAAEAQPVTGQPVAAVPAVPTPVPQAVPAVVPLGNTLGTGEPALDRPLTRRERAMARRERRRAAREARMAERGAMGRPERGPSDSEIEDMLRWERQRAAKRKREKNGQSSGTKVATAKNLVNSSDKVATNKAANASKPAAPAKSKRNDDDIDIDALLKEVERPKKRKKKLKLNQSDDPLGF